MRRLLSAIALLLFAARALADPATATLYFYGPAPTPDAIAALAPDAKTSTTPGAEGSSQVVLAWPDFSIAITIDPTWNADDALPGIHAMIELQPSAVKQAGDVRWFRSHLDGTTMGYAAVVTPDFDPAGKAAKVLTKIVHAGGGGYLFAHQSFYDEKGHCLFGAAGDPVKLDGR